MLREIVEAAKMSQERFLSKNFPGHSVVDMDDDLLIIEIGQELTRKEFNDLFKGVKITDPEFPEVEVITPKNKRYSRSM